MQPVMPEVMKVKQRGPGPAKNVKGGLLFEGCDLVAAESIVIEFVFYTQGLKRFLKRRTAIKFCLIPRRMELAVEFPCFPDIFGDRRLVEGIIVVIEGKIIILPDLPANGIPPERRTEQEPVPFIMCDQLKARPKQRCRIDRPQIGELDQAVCAVKHIHVCQVTRTNIFSTREKPSL